MLFSAKQYSNAPCTWTPSTRADPRLGDAQLPPSPCAHLAPLHAGAAPSAANHGSLTTSRRHGDGSGCPVGEPVVVILFSAKQHDKPHTRHVHLRLPWRPGLRCRCSGALTWVPGGRTGVVGARLSSSGPCTARSLACTPPRSCRSAAPPRPRFCGAQASWRWPRVATLAATLAHVRLLGMAVLLSVGGHSAGWRRAKPRSGSRGRATRAPRIS